jgi:hypothetical protein
MGFEFIDCCMWRGTGRIMQGVFMRTGGAPFGNVMARGVGAFGTEVRGISMGNSDPDSTLAIDRCETCSWPFEGEAMHGDIFQPNPADGEQGVYQITRSTAQRFQGCGTVPDGCTELPVEMTEQECLARQAAWIAAHPR